MQVQRNRLASPADPPWAAPARRPSSPNGPRPLPGARAGVGGFVAVDLDRDDIALLRPETPTPSYPPAPVAPAPSNLRELWTLARQGRLEDWSYWQINGTYYQKAAHAAVMLGIWAAFAFGVWQAVVAIQQNNKARTPGP